MSLYLMAVSDTILNDHLPALINAHHVPLLVRGMVVPTQLCIETKWKRMASEQTPTRPQQWCRRGLNSGLWICQRRWNLLLFWSTSLPHAASVLLPKHSVRNLPNHLVLGLDQRNVIAIANVNHKHKMDKSSRILIRYGE